MISFNINSHGYCILVVYIHVVFLAYRVEGVNMEMTNIFVVDSFNYDDLSTVTLSYPDLALLRFIVYSHFLLVILSLFTFTCFFVCFQYSISSYAFDLLCYSTVLIRYFNSHLITIFLGRILVYLN